ncbi:MAG: hypothetical protein ACE3L7_03030 [Candidatus Pristimantibacillus sp.]
MWWKLKKLVDDEDRIVYAYSRESDTLDGEIEFLKQSKVFNCLRLASGDTQASVERFYAHVWGTISKYNAPEEKFIAIG